jgi:hypothetical protein
MNDDVQGGEKGVPTPESIEAMRRKLVDAARAAVSEEDMAEMENVQKMKARARMGDASAIAFMKELKERSKSAQNSPGD